MTTLVLPAVTLFVSLTDQARPSGSWTLLNRLPVISAQRGRRLPSAPSPVSARQVELARADWTSWRPRSEKKRSRTMSNNEGRAHHENPFDTV
jgi:hypothetical protein